MRITALVAVVLFTLTGCLDEPENKMDPSKSPAAVLDPAELTTVQWIDSTRDFGKIIEGQKLEVSFRYKNTGNKPLVIYAVRPSCGCTLPETPGKPLAPGETGEIRATFNSEGRAGVNKKDIYVQASTKGTQSHVLHFDVEVVPAEKGK